MVTNQTFDELLLLYHYPNLDTTVMGCLMNFKLCQCLWKTSLSYHRQQGEIECDMYRNAMIQCIHLHILYMSE